MKVTITGGCGFLGRTLAGAILARPELTVDGVTHPVTALWLVDSVVPADLSVVPAGPVGEPPHGEPARVEPVPVEAVQVDLAAASVAELAALPAFAEADAVIHLAAAVSGACEADLDLGVAVNIRGGLSVFDACRASGRRPVVVFASSVAVYGGWPVQPLPPVVTDTTMPTPTSSYGTQKLMLEQLLADYTRRGELRGRTVRPMTVVVRPGAPNAAASSFLSGIVREPLRGEPASCPVAADVGAVVASPDATIAGMLHAMAATGEEWGAPLGVNLPGVSTTAGEIVATLAELAGDEVAALVRWEPDDRIAAIVGGWPAAFHSERAARLGLPVDDGIAAIIAQYIARYTG